jgi:hypothetical protein
MLSSMSRQDYTKSKYRGMVFILISSKDDRVVVLKMYKKERKMFGVVNHFVSSGILYGGNK